MGDPLSFRSSRNEHSLLHLARNFLVSLILLVCFMTFHSFTLWTCTGAFDASERRQRDNEKTWTKEGSDKRFEGVNSHRGERKTFTTSARPLPRVEAASSSWLEEPKGIAALPRCPPTTLF